MKDEKMNKDCDIAYHAFLAGPHSSFSIDIWWAAWQAAHSQPVPQGVAEQEEIDAVIACLGDDASETRHATNNNEDEVAANMLRAAELTALGMMQADRVAELEQDAERYRREAIAEDRALNADLLDAAWPKPTKRWEERVVEDPHLTAAIEAAKESK